MNFGSQTQTNPQAAFHADVDARASFIMKTYVHLVGAVFAFIAAETAIFTLGIDRLVFGTLINLNVNPNFLWLGIMVLFMGGGYVARKMAFNATSPLMAYAGLGLEVAVWTAVFIFPLSVAVHQMPGVLAPAATVTALIFGGLTAVVFITRKDFSFMRGILGVAAIGSFAMIVCALLFNFHLGVFFSGFMVMLAAGYILYDTSNVLHHFRTDQHVAASVVLFGSVALLFWYILRIFMSRR